MFRAGDVVSIMEDRAEVTKLQKGHGEWREDMTAVSIWIYNLQQYSSTRKFSAVVPLLNLHILLCKHTNVIYLYHYMQSLGQLGRVVRVVSNAAQDVKVSVAGRRWTFNSACLKPAPGENPASSDLDRSE